MKKAVINWSGGKDSAYLIHYLKKFELFEPELLFTFFNRQDHKVQVHLLPEELIEKQAESLGLELWKSFINEDDNNQYLSEIESQLRKMESIGVQVSAYADIYLQDIKDFRINIHKNLKIKPIFPLWKIPTIQLMEDFIDAGFKAVVVCIDDDKLPREFLGSQLDYEFLKSLPEGVDPAGENGEFHSFVYDGPIFNKPVEFQKNGITTKKIDYKTRDGEKSISLSYINLSS